MYRGGLDAAASVKFPGGAMSGRFSHARAIESEQSVHGFMRREVLVGSRKASAAMSALLSRSNWCSGACKL
jgi:hypothetical protein